MVFSQLLLPLVTSVTGQWEEFHLKETFAEEQVLVARAILHVKSDDVDTQQSMLSTLRKISTNAGPHRALYIIPAVIFQHLWLANTVFSMRNKLEGWEKRATKIYTAVRSTLLKLAEMEHYGLAIRLLLQAALVVDTTQFDASEGVAYEYCSQVRI